MSSILVAADGFRNPIQAGDIALGDPSILLADDMYYLFGTTDSDGRHKMRCWVSRDLAAWSTIGHVLHLDDDSWSQATFWAPEVIEHDGRFIMSYTASHGREQPMQICLAMADHPEGPYREWQAPLFTSEAPCWDSHLFIDDDGEAYLYYTSANQTWAVRMRGDLTGVKEDAVLCGGPEQAWERPPEDTRFWCNEGPSVFRAGDRYFMTWSANHYARPLYAVGYGTAPHPLGPWTKATENPILATTAAIGLYGPGHNSFVLSPDGRDRFMVYHAHHDQIDHGSTRDLRIDRVTVTDGRLCILGPSVTDQPPVSGASADAIPAHLLDLHVPARARQLAKRCRDDVVKTLRDMEGMVEGRPWQASIVVSNPCADSLRVHYRWAGEATPDPATAMIDIPAGAMRTVTFTWPTPRRQADAARLHWELEGAATGDGDITIPIARCLPWGDQPNRAVDIVLAERGQVVVGAENWHGPEDLRSQARVWQDDQGLNLEVTIHGAMASNVTDIEVYLDTRNEDQRGLGPRYARGVVQAVWPREAEIPSHGADDPLLAGATASWTAIADGWQCRMTLPAVSGSAYHFDLGINANNSTGKGRCQMMWSGTANNWRDPRQFGRLGMPKQ